MRKVLLTYSLLGLICLLTGGCATSMKSNKVSVGQNVPCNVNIQQGSPLRPPVDILSAQIDSLSSFISSYNKTLNVDDVRVIAEAILKVSNRHKVNYKVVTALVAIESGFRPDAKSPSGALGLGQLMPATARGLNVSNPFDPLDNLNGAVKLFRSHLESYNGDINFALGAYKMGSGTVSRRGISQSSTISYIKKIRSVYDMVP